MSKNVPYSVEELIENSSFIDYVLDRASTEEVAQWDAYGEQFPDEKEHIKEAKLFVLHLATQDEEVDKEAIKEVRNNLKTFVASNQNAKQRSLIRPWMYAAAACLAFLVVFSLFMNNETTTTIIASAGEQKTHTLPDGSSIQLNAESEIAYEEAQYDQTDRVINLKGQAFFEVEKGKPFIVKTATGQVEVLGTSFDVYDRDDYFVVGCKTGKVRVTSQSNSTILLPGEEARTVQNELTKVSRSLNEIASWEKGTFYFESEKLDVVLKEISRQFKTKITYTDPSLAQEMYTGYFVNNHIDSALINVCWPLRLTFEHKNKTVVISKN